MSMAHLAMALAGFAAITLAVNADQGLKFTWEVQALLWFCFGALFLALIHVALLAANVSLKVSSKICSFLMFLFGLAWLLIHGIGIFTGEITLRVMGVLVTSIGAMNWLWQLQNALFGGSRSYIVFLGGLIWYLLAGVFTLMSTIPQ